MAQYYEGFFVYASFYAKKKGATPLDKPLFAAETKTNLQLLLSTRLQFSHFFAPLDVPFVGRQQ